MGKLTVTTFTTLDGVMQSPGAPEEDARGGFRHGGWAFPFDGPEFGEFMVSVFDKVEAFLLGRRTYEIFAGHWPRVTDPNDPIATKLNALPKYVATRTLQRVEWQNSQIIRDVPAEVAALKQKLSGELQVHGSGDLVQSLLEHDLIDQLNILIYPVLLGSGQRLFASGTTPAALKLLYSRVAHNGLIMTTYERAGRPTYGSFALE